MKRVKLIYVVMLISAIVLVSFRGGETTWFLFYFVLSIPILALLYVLYVYFRLRIGQQVTRYAKKGERIPYQLKMANEDILLMTGIRLQFYADTVLVMQRSDDGTVVPYEQESYSLLPHQKKELELDFYCKVRGTNAVGVKCVSVLDLFGLFTITYPMPEHIRLTALPRILSLAQLQSKLEKGGLKKNRPAITRLQDILDFELRKYIQGDSLRRIHWKNSARSGELLVRKQAPQELYEFVIIMDCSPRENKTDLLRMQIEDNIIETAVALSYAACRKKIRTHVVWCADGLCEMQIDHATDFDKFYNLCAELIFESDMTLEEIWEACERKMGENPAYWLVGCEVSPALLQKVDKSCRMGGDVVLIDTGKEPL